MLETPRSKPINKIPAPSAPIEYKEKPLPTLEQLITADFIGGSFTATERNLWRGPADTTPKYMHVSSGTITKINYKGDFFEKPTSISVPAVVLTLENFKTVAGSAETPMYTEEYALSKFFPWHKNVYSDGSLRLQGGGVEVTLTKKPKESKV